MTVVGIDVGYQTAFIAVARQGGIETVANDYSDRCTPAVVSFGEKQRSVGASAKNQMISNMKNTVWGWRKLIGRPFRDIQVQQERHLLPYEIMEAPNGATGIRVHYCDEHQVFSPEQVNAMLFTKLKATVSAALNTKVVDVVINVPNYYSDVERRAMLDSAQMAGLNVLRLMNDTTAAALAYGIYKQDLPAPEEKARNVVFLDMGHSDLQLAAVSYNKGKLKVLATAADANLGGQQFDRILADHFTVEFQKRYKIDATSKPRAYIRLLQECEKLKKLMSANTQDIPLNVECFMDDVDVTGKMARATMEEKASHLLQRAEDVMRALLNNANLHPDEIYSVELIGGSSRIPMLKQLVTKVFGKETSHTLNADEAVARGCALQCAILSPTFRVRDFTITDCQPYPIVLEWQGEEMGSMEVFPRSHAVPFSKMMTFQRSDMFVLRAKYAGEIADIPCASPLIGDFIIDKVVPQANGDSSKVKVKVRINGHGIFYVQSATMVEKLPGQDDDKDELMEVDENGAGNGDEDSKKEDQKEQQQPEQPEQAEQTETKGAADADSEKMQTDGEETTQSDQKEGDKVEGDKDNKKPEKEKKESAKKKKTVKNIDLPVDARVPSLSPEALNLLIEKEGQMVAADKLEKERVDAKNAVEEYVYDIRDKLYGDLGQYVKEHDKDSMMKMLEETENWLYDEGEDCKKQIYIDKLAALKTLGNPIVGRQKEALERPRELEQLGRTIMRVRKFLDAVTKQDEKYIHLDAEDVKKVDKCLKEKEDWFNTNSNSLHVLAAYENPKVTCADIRGATQSMCSTCDPIINKPKPKPKKEEPPPAEEKKDANDAGSQGDSANTAADNKEQEGQGQPAAGEQQANADMELD